MARTGSHLLGNGGEFGCKQFEAHRRRQMDDAPTRTDRGGMDEAVHPGGVRARARRSDRSQARLQADT